VNRRKRDDRSRKMHPARELDRLDRLMRERGGLAPVPESVPLHKMAEAGKRSELDSVSTGTNT
jgi:hypothetical protein